MVSPQVALDVKWKILPLMGSDHCPLLATVIIRQTREKRQQRSKGFQYRLGGKSIVRVARRCVREEKNKRKHDRQGRRKTITAKRDQKSAGKRCMG